MDNTTYTDKYKATDADLLRQMEQIMSQMNLLILCFIKSKRPEHDRVNWSLYSEQGKVLKLLQDGWGNIFHAKQGFKPLALEDEDEWA